MDKQQVLQGLRAILFGVMLLACQLGYVTIEDMSEFIKPAFLPP